MEINLQIFDQSSKQVPQNIQQKKPIQQIQVLSDQEEKNIISEKFLQQVFKLKVQEAKLTRSKHNILKTLYIQLCLKGGTSQQKQKKFSSIIRYFIQKNLKTSKNEQFDIRKSNFVQMMLPLQNQQFVQSQYILYGCDLLSQKHIQKIFQKHSPSIKWINASHCKLTFRQKNSGWEAVIDNCKNLDTLEKDLQSAIKVQNLLSNLQLQNDEEIQEEQKYNQDYLKIQKLKKQYRLLKNYVQLASYYEMGFKRRLMIRNVTSSQQVLGYNLNASNSQNTQNSQASQQKGSSDYKNFLKAKQKFWKDIENIQIVKKSYQQIQREIEQQQSKKFRGKAQSSNISQKNSYPSNQYHYRNRQNRNFNRERYPYQNQHRSQQNYYQNQYKTSENQYQNQNQEISQSQGFNENQQSYEYRNPQRNHRKNYQQNFNHYQQNRNQGHFNNQAYQNQNQYGNTQINHFYHHQNNNFGGRGGNYSYERNNLEQNPYQTKQYRNRSRQNNFYKNGSDIQSYKNKRQRKWDNIEKDFDSYIEQRDGIAMIKNTFNQQQFRKPVFYHQGTGAPVYINPSFDPRNIPFINHLIPQQMKRYLPQNMHNRINQNRIQSQIQHDQNQSHSYSYEYEYKGNKHKNIKNDQKPTLKQKQYQKQNNFSKNNTIHTVNIKNQKQRSIQERNIQLMDPNISIITDNQVNQQTKHPTQKNNVNRQFEEKVSFQKGKNENNLENILDQINDEADQIPKNSQQVEYKIFSRNKQSSRLGNDDEQDDLDFILKQSQKNQRGNFNIKSEYVSNNYSNVPNGSSSYIVETIELQKIPEWMNSNKLKMNNGSSGMWQVQGDATRSGMIGMSESIQNRGERTKSIPKKKMDQLNTNKN